MDGDGSGRAFDISDEPLDEPPERFVVEERKLRLDADRLWLLKVGECLVCTRDRPSVGMD